MKTRCIVIVLACSVYFGASYANDRTNRMFSLFNVVKFKNDECQATSSSSLKGTCLTAEECTSAGGSKDGNCAASFGVCCIIKINTCGGKVTRNGSYIENPGYPTQSVAQTTGCAFTIQKCSSDICQIRLDFVDSVLKQPPTNTAAACTTDYLTIVAGSNPTTARQQNPPLTCGSNVGAHMYLDAGSTNTAATLTFTVAAANTAKWRIKVSQIECFSPNRAPDGCLQYFTGVSNTVTSFNFDGTTTCATGCLSANQDYNVCFRTEQGMCGMQYKVSTVTSGDAFLLTNAETQSGIAAAVCDATANANAVLEIRKVVPVTPATQDMFCGNFLSIVDNSLVSTSLTTRGTPFGFRFRVGAITSNQLPGFSLDTTQVPCNANT